MGSELSEPYCVLVLGGYGHFGGRICRALGASPAFELSVAGRSLDAARRFVATWPHADRAHPVALDIDAGNLANELKRLDPDVVIHTCGPFQGQDYRVARASIAAGAHYIDLADARAYVAGIAELDSAARAAGVLVVSGASTLPALSSAVIDELTRRFGAARGVTMSIAPGQRTPRGLATLKAVMSYCGHPFKALIDGGQRDVYGWQGIHRHRYPDLGTRWLSWCDVPDLEVLPQRYPTLASVRFDAALELAPLQWGFWLMAGLARAGIVRDWSRWAQVLQPIGDWFNRFGSDCGGMHVGLDVEPAPGMVPRVRAVRTVHWNLVARKGHGPEIPCIPAIVIARKLAAGELQVRGAIPCMGLMSLQEFTAAVSHLDIRWSIEGRE